MSERSPSKDFTSSFFSRYGSHKECEGPPKMRSLQLDTVMQGRQHQSPSRLLQLPNELLDRTFDLLEEDKKTLAALALVNSVCLYLARVRQFKEIHFDYSPQSHELVESLGNKNKTKLPFPIGIFVRKFTFAPLVDFFSTTHPDLFKAIYGDPLDKSPPSPQPQEVIDKLLIEAQKHYVDQRKSIFIVIASKLPNLIVLVWKDSVQLDGDFIESLSRCSAEHVKLERIHISKDWPMEPPIASTRWNLRTLELNVKLMDSAHRSGANAPMGDPPTNDGDGSSHLCFPQYTLSKLLLYA